jgi:hypothetical protein
LTVVARWKLNLSGLVAARIRMIAMATTSTMAMMAMISSMKGSDFLN